MTEIKWGNRTTSEGEIINRREKGRGREYRQAYRQTWWMVYW